MKRPLHEKLLVYRVRVKKDPEAFGKIYDLYVTRIYRFVFFKVSSNEEAQDITADVFLKAWQYLLEERSKAVRNLGVMMNDDLSITAHVNKIVGQCFYSLRKIKINSSFAVH